MKKRILILAFLAFSLTGFSQSLLKPVPDNLFKKVAGTELSTSKWLPRLTVGVSVTQNTYNKETKVIETKFAQFIGFGIGYQHYVAQADGAPFNNYGANLLLLTPTVDGGGLGVGLFGNLSIITLGVDYNFLFKKISVDTGVVLKF